MPVGTSLLAVRFGLGDIDQLTLVGGYGCGKTHLANCAIEQQRLITTNYTKRGLEDRIGRERGGGRIASRVYAARTNVVVAVMHGVEDYRTGDVP